MIEKIKKKFILLATLSMVMLMTVLVSSMNIMNYSSVVSEADRILSVLSQPGVPRGDAAPRPETPTPPIRKHQFLPNGMSPEVPYESRYFTAVVTHNGDIEETDFSRIISVDRELAEDYVQEALKRKRDTGFIGAFRYMKISEEQTTRILFLDFGRKLDSFYRFLWISVSVGVLGCILVFVLFLFSAERIVRPIAESYEKQKRFISDAGHEIKTPLTIIHANLDLLECDFAGNEDLEEIRQQVRRLGTLTNDLIYLSKMEEPGSTLTMMEFPVSDIVLETGEMFYAVSQAQRKEYHIQIEPRVSMTGSQDAVRQLVTILLDNAMKYSPEGGKVELQMSVNRGNIILTVFNTTQVPVPEENISRVFERFYRTDTSRNSQTGGHGIGLSIAQAIVKAHHGKIKAESKNGYDFKITVIFPTI